MFPGDFSNQESVNKEINWSIRELKLVINGPNDRGNKHLWNVCKLYETTQRNIPGGCHLYTQISHFIFLLYYGWRKKNIDSVVGRR